MLILLTLLSTLLGCLNEGNTSGSTSTQLPCNATSDCSLNGIDCNLSFNKLCSEINSRCTPDECLALCFWIYSDTCTTMEQYTENTDHSTTNDTDQSTKKNIDQFTGENMDQSSEEDMDQSSEEDKAEEDMEQSTEEDKDKFTEEDMDQSTEEDMDQSTETAPPTNSQALSTIIIVAGTLAVVLILALLMTIVIVLWLVFRYKTNHIQQRYDDPPNIERYVSKEPESLPMTENRDPMYDTIDDSTIAMKANQQAASLHKGSQPPFPPAIHSGNRIPMSNGSAQITTGIDNHVYFKGSPEPPTIEPVLPYEEPVSALNSFHLSSEKETTTSSKTETFNESKTTFQHQQKMKPEQIELEPAKTIKRELVSADYAILEGPGHMQIKGDESSPATVNNNRVELSQNTNHEPTMDASIADYAVLEGHTPSDSQPYECPDPRAGHSTHSAGEANGTEPSASRNNQNNSSGTMNTVQPVYATLEPANMITEESCSKYTTLNKN